jgi:hypothetical protein
LASVVADAQFDGTRAPHATALLRGLHPMRVNMRRLLGPLFAPLSRAKHSRSARLLSAAAHLPAQMWRHHANKPWFAVDMSSPKGLGALISEALLICRYAEDRGLRPLIVSSNPLYADHPGRDFLIDYFEPPPVDPLHALHMPVTHSPMQFRTLESFFHLKLPLHLDLDRANQIFWRYFKPRIDVQARVDAVLSQLPGKRFDVSVHYRGTDKVLEAPSVAYELVTSTLHRCVAQGMSIRRVFLATDDPNFDRYLRREFPAWQFTDFLCGQPTDTSRGRHFSSLSPADKTLEALVNSLLLAASPLCIRSVSYLSAVSRIVNPALRTITLNQDHWGSRAFPECEIHEDEVRYGHGLSNFSSTAGDPC